MVIKAGWLEEQQKEYACVAGASREVGRESSQEVREVGEAMPPVVCNPGEELHF